jgi:hypothetical protein
MRRIAQSRVVEEIIKTDTLPPSFSLAGRRTGPSTGWSDGSCATTHRRSGTAKVGLTRKRLDTHCGSSRADPKVFASASSDSRVNRCVPALRSMWLATETTLPRRTGRSALRCEPSRPEQSSTRESQVVARRQLPLWFIPIDDERNEIREGPTRRRGSR